MEGAATGAGGILLGLADFPLLIAIKIKLLFEIASLYGHSVNDYKERVFLLHIFELAFSSAKHRRNVGNAGCNYRLWTLRPYEPLTGFQQHSYSDLFVPAVVVNLQPVNAGLQRDGIDVDFCLAMHSYLRNLHTLIVIDLNRIRLRRT